MDGNYFSIDGYLLHLLFTNTETGSVENGSSQTSEAPLY